MLNLGALDPNSPFRNLQPAPANPFDRFDTAQPASGLSPRFAGVYGPGAQVQSAGPAPAPAGNPFDQFDAQRQAGPDGAAGSFARHQLNTWTMGLADPLVAAIQSTVGDPTNPTSQAEGWDDRYHENLHALRAVGMSDEIAHPIASTAGDIVGGLTLPVGRIASVGDAMRVGGKFGLASGVGNAIADDKDMGEIADSGISGALTGMVTGGTLHRVGNAIGDALAPKAGNWVGALKGAAKSAYDRLANNGVKVSADALNAMGDSAVDKFATRMGYDVNPEVAASIYPQSSAALKLLSAYGTEGKLAGNTASFHDLDQLRRVVADAAGNAQSSDKFMARQILDHVDNFVDRLGPGHLDTADLDAARSAVNSATGQKGALVRQIAGIEQNHSGALAARGAAGAGTRARYMQLRGDLAKSDMVRADALNQFQQQQALNATGAQSGVQDLNNARDYYRRAMKADTLQRIMDKAQNNSTMFGQSGYENALRRGFLKLLNNDRGIAAFNPEERDAIKQVASGGSKFSATNILRDVGKLHPQGAVPLLAEIGAYGAMGPGALAIPAAGVAGRVGATILQKRAAQRTVEIAAKGGPGAAVLNNPAAAAGLPRALAMKSARSLPRLTASTLAVLPMASRMVAQ